MFKLNIKTIDKKCYSMDVDLSWKTEELKTKIEATHGFEAAKQQLVYSGKVLKDGQDLASYGLTADNIAKAFLVLMITKPKKEKPAAKAEEAAAPPAAPAPAVDPPAPAAIPQNPAAAQPAAPAAVPAAPAAVAAVNPEDQGKIDMLMGMGLGDEATVKAALAAAFGNTEVAANYLMSPELMANIQQNVGGAEFGGIPVNPMAGGGGGGMPQGMEGMNEQQLMDLMNQQPEMFAPIVEELAQSDPALLQQIQQNPQQFVQMLLQGMQEGAFEEGDEEYIGGEGMDGVEEGDEEMDGGEEIQLTEEQNKAVERLQAMFPHVPQDMILQTFQAAGGDEAMCANLLLEGALN